MNDYRMGVAMGNVKSGSRRGKALATQHTIIQAARGEFVQRGFHGATIARIAARAHVATQTVYFTFHSKPELMSAVMGNAVMGDDSEIPQATAWWAAMVSAPRADDVLRSFMSASGRTTRSCNGYVRRCLPYSLHRTRMRERSERH